MFSDSAKTTPAMVNWWNGYSALLDFSNPAATQWYKDQLNNLVINAKWQNFIYD